MSDNIQDDIKVAIDRIKEVIDFALTINPDFDVKDHLEKMLRDYTIKANGYMDSAAGHLNDDNLRIEILALGRIIKNL